MSRPAKPGRRRHWQAVWTGGSADQLGWFQAEPEPSLGLILKALPGRDSSILDVGGGDSRLVDCLLAEGYGDLTVLDVSAAALQRARERLGDRAGDVRWIEADVTDFQPPRPYRLWHDRAVFHFLTESADRAAYRETLRAALAADGQVLISTFSLAGPSRCSGLDVVRYSAASLDEELGRGFRLVDSLETTHRTPAGNEQSFLVCRFARSARASDCGDG